MNNYLFENKILSTIGEEFWLFITVFPNPVGSLAMMQTKYNDSASIDLKISEKIVKAISTKSRKCK